VTDLTVPLASIRSLAESAVTSGGYAGLAAIMALETVLPPIPSDVVLPLAGVEISRGNPSFVFALFAATAGALAGALALYAIARFGGRRAVLRLRRLLHVDESDLDRARVWFDRRGILVVFFGRMIPGPSSHRYEHVNVVGKRDRASTCRRRHRRRSRCGTESPCASR
jgi:membrane protein DedA with SNARE-associated domain